jgi:TetR/AcrR family transcriptional regulator, transcriptional repressor for nem operon
MNGHIQNMSRPSVKEEIVEAAVKVLHLGGFNVTGVQDIADAAGVPKGAFYNQFESKEALAAEALDRYWQGALNSLEMLKDDSVLPTRLKSYFRKLNEIGRKVKYRPGCVVENLSTEMSDQSSLIRERLAAILARWTRAIDDCVEQAQSDGSRRRYIEAKAIATFLLNFLGGGRFCARRPTGRRSVRPIRADRVHRPHRKALSAALFVSF